MEPRNFDRLYQRIGEFVVSFQWLENQLRQIGWVILDPHRREWPPLALRDETNAKLIKKVEKLYVELMDSIGTEYSAAQKKAFKDLALSCHAIRDYRNNLLHSAFIEIKAGGELIDLLRSNPEIEFNPQSGEMIFDQEILTEESIDEQMKKLAVLIFQIDSHHVQLLHWAPFDKIRHSADKK